MSLTWISHYNPFVAAMNPRQDVLSLHAHEDQHRRARNDGRISRLLVMHMGGGWGNQFPTLMSSLPLAVVLNRALIVHFPYPIESSLLPNRVDWRPWDPTIVERPEKLDTFDMNTLSEDEYHAQQSKDMLHVLTGKINVWGNRHFSQ